MSRSARSRPSRVGSRAEAKSPVIVRAGVAAAAAVRGAVGRIGRVRRIARRMPTNRSPRTNADAPPLAAERVADEDVEASPAPVGEDDGAERRRPRRGRSRRPSRRDDEPETSLSEGETPDVAAEAAEEVSGEDDSGSEEVDNLSDWSVPSWQELVDSLYRPDR